MSTRYGGKPRIFKTPEDMEKKWEEFKAYCDNKYVMKHEFSQRQGTFVSAELKHRVSYTIEGFCVYCKIARQTFYDTYDHDPAYSVVVSRIREECEADVREKFETGEIPPQLSALWMSKFGYGTNNNVTVDAKELVDDWIDGVMSHGDKG
ncbi:MAG: DNA-packaging protein [Oscillospiraceae bacterium]|nr:DNA-packaging protein [Oscillospiraceae bacterium]